MSTNSHKNAYLGIFLLGIVSLLGDIVYEGSRGVVPDYLKFLGASATIVGFIGGLGDFLGYAIRLVSGFLADATRAYWKFIFLGYGLIVAIPLLGLPLGLEIAIILILLERIGKALRSPSRDTVLSIISKDVGAGKAFGIHELMDQIGAVIGPLFVALLMLFTSNNYSFTFGSLFIPFIVLIAFLTYTYKRIGLKTQVIEDKRISETEGKRLTSSFYIYVSAVLINTIGLIPYTLILYRASEILGDTNQWIVPLIYLLIQGVDAPMALIAGYAYDKFGLRILAMPFILSIFPALFTVASVELTFIIVAAIFFGLVLGTQESIYRAAVSKLAQVSSRGTAYGIFNTAYGLGFLVSGVVYGFMMELKIPFAMIIVYTLAMQITATILLFNVHQRIRGQQK